ncbi:TonB-dependent receptor plug domain-containing protein [uncultured Desulfobacter sp.]|uniref:TonB-dependent receptor plug domain-containing protein n=1 Tax=uncultured Desulfobacter sp. TaxID=240139 RepID=UPI002AA6F36F|nr:TonB-dependent receptor plug domain-containing protein [uncultured Desulfobacter sp.]
MQEALDAYSKATGTTIVCSNELIKGKNSPGAQNTSAGDALQQILQGTGLTFEMADNNTAILKEKKSTEKSELQQNRMKTNLEEVTVTAQKREENVQEVPISMTVFNEFAIEDRKIESIQDVASYTSNLALIPKGAITYLPSIRGISSTIGTSSQATSIIIDGIPVSNAGGFNLTLMGIERIEVLKGPQGTLYGKDTEAGVINIITKQPDNETRGKAGVEFGEDSKKKYTFSASGPIVEDKLFLGVSAKHYLLFDSRRYTKSGKPYQ